MLYECFFTLQKAGGRCVAFYRQMGPDLAMRTIEVEFGIMAEKSIYLHKAVGGEFESIALRKADAQIP